MIMSLELPPTQGITGEKFFPNSLLRQLAFVIFYYKRVILVTFWSVVALSLAAAVFLPPVYVSSAKFSMSLSQQLDPLKKEPQYDIKNQMVRILLGQKELILSNQVLQVAAKRIYPQASPQELAELVDKLTRRITVTPPKGEDFEGSNVYYVNVQAPSAARAHELALAVTQAYKEAYAATSKSKSLYSYDFYAEQVEGLYKEMRAKDEKLRDFEVKHAANLVDILNMEGGTNKTNVEIGPKILLTETTRNRQRLVDQTLAQRKIIEILEDEAANNTLPVVMADMEGTGKALTAYRSKVTQLQLQLTELKTQFTGNYEPLRQLEKELTLSIELLRKEFWAIVKAKRIELESLDAQVQGDDRVIKQLEDKLVLMAQERSAYENLKQDYLLAKDAYVDARSKLEQARLAVALNQGKQDLTQVEMPELPLTPSKPNRLLLVALGVCAGACLGLALALSLDYFDHTLKTPEEVERFLQLPCLASVSRLGG